MSVLSSPVGTTFPWGGIGAAFRSPQGPDNRKRLVILGGGFAGSTVARNLQHEFDTVLVDPRAAFENTCALYRVAVEPALYGDNVVSYAEFLPGVKVVHGAAKSIDPKAKTINLGDTSLPYDYLVVATGCSYDRKFNAPNVVPLNCASAVASVGSRLGSATSIAVLGGGAAGVEAAIELAEASPNLLVHLLHSGSALMNRYSSEASKYAHEVAARYSNLVLHLNTRVEAVVGSEDSVRISTSGGGEMAAPLVLVATGLKPNSDFVPSDYLDTDGCIRVDPYLRIRGLNDCFAVGDVTAADDKLASTAIEQAGVVIHNIKATEHGSPLKSYARRALRRLCVMLGRRDAMVLEKDRIRTGEAWARRKQAISLSARVLPIFQAAVSQASL